MPEKDWTDKFFDDDVPKLPSSEETAKKETPSSHHQNIPSIKKLLDPELESRFSEIEKIHNEIEKKLDDVYSQSTFSKKSITDYLDNPNNFNSLQWAQIEKRRQEFQDQIWSILGKKQKDKAMKKSEGKLAKEGKGKTLGSRKKWMPMR